MHGTVRASLWPIFERSRQDITPEIQTFLFGQLAVLGKDQVKSLLETWRPIGIHIAQTKSSRERRKLIEEIAPEKPYWPLYAAVAWSARTLALAEYLDRGDLPVQPKKWAGGHALALVNEFFDDETWLWPFDGETPWDKSEEEEFRPG